MGNNELTVDVTLYPPLPVALTILNILLCMALEAIADPTLRGIASGLVYGLLLMLLANVLVLLPIAGIFIFKYWALPKLMEVLIIKSNLIWIPNLIAFVYNIVLNIVATVIIVVWVVSWVVK